MKKTMLYLLLSITLLASCRAIAPGAETKENATTLVTTYVDSNRNGTWEPPETALPGVLIAARSNIHGISTYFADISDVEGKSLITASYTHYFDLTAFTPCGYEATTPTTVEAERKNMFGFAPINPQSGDADFYILLWHDGNQDGEYQSGEEPIAGEVLYLDPGLPWQYDEHDIVSGQLTAQTDSGGEASANFGNTCGDVTITIPDGWLPTTPAKDGSLEDGKYKISYQPGRTNIFLGVIPDPKMQTIKEKTAKIQTYVDANGNGELDAGEDNLPNVLIAAQSNINTEIMRTAQLTDVNGRIDVTASYTHKFDLVAITPCGYEPTTRTQIEEGQIPTVSLSGNIFEIGFVPVKPQSGTANLNILFWQDENQDGLYQSGEAPISGEILWLDPSLPWHYAPDIVTGQLSVSTDASGRAVASFGNSCGEVTIIIPDGWKPSTTIGAGTWEGNTYRTTYQPEKNDIFLGVMPTIKVVPVQ